MTNIIRLGTYKYCAKVTTYNSACTQLSSQSCLSFLPNTVPWYMYSQAFLTLINHTNISMLAVSSVTNLQYTRPSPWKRGPGY